VGSTREDDQSGQDDGAQRSQVADVHGDSSRLISRASSLQRTGYGDQQPPGARQGLFG
jgi:hypothetical protein